MKMNFINYIKNIINAKSYTFYITTTAALVGATVVSGLVGAKAAGDAASSRANAANKGILEKQRQFDITQKEGKKYRDAGANGLANFQRMANAGFSYTANDFANNKDPGYAFRKQEGLRALDRVMGRRGQLNSGARYRGLMNLSQNLASQEFNSARNRAYQDYNNQLNSYRTLANMGANETNSLGNQRMNLASNISNGYNQIGNSQAAGDLGQAGAFTGALNSGMQLYGLSQYNQGSNLGDLGSYYAHGNPNVMGDAYGPAYPTWSNG